ncbi:MAG: MATE family efflux transporter, partial [Lachnospiraceae bacterium]
MEGKLFSNKELKRLILPLIFEQMLAMAVGLVDTIMVSSLGEAAISGVSLVDMINQLAIGVFAAMATGGAVVAAQYIGHRDKKKACESANQLFFVAIGISLVIMIICLAFKHDILRLFFGSIDERVMKSATTYFVISAISYPFLAAYNSGAALFRAMSNSKISLQISFVMNVINAVLNAVFIFGLHLGVAGAALASLIARAVAAIIISILLKKSQGVIHFVKLERPWIQKDMVKKILYIGVPNGLESGMFQLGRVLVVSIISGFGTVQIAANAVANNIDGLGVIPGSAMGLAMITVVGQCVGAGDYKQANYYIKKLMKITYGSIWILDGAILLALPWILQWYHLSQDTIELAWILIMIHNGCAMLLWPLSFVLPNALRASNDVKFTMCISVFSMWAFRILLSVILGKYFKMGAIGVWIAMIADWIFRDICFVWRFISKK